MRASLLLCSIAFGFGCGSSRDLGPCNPGDHQCSGMELLECINGEYQHSMDCPQSCSPTLGCTLCVPGTGTCSGDMAHTCNADGSGYDDVYCDPVQGESCDTTVGACTGDCSPKTLGNSYIGCEYYPTVTGNTTGTVFDFAVAIANTTANPAMVTLDGGALTSTQMVMVAPNSVVVQTLPWVPALKLCDQPSTDGCQTVPAGALAMKGAYHLRSTSPITVYQFNSLEYEKSSQFSYSNDASLLLPTNVWRTKYFAAGWVPLNSGGVVIYPDELAVSAAYDSTSVTITTTAAAGGVGGAPSFMAGASNNVMLNAGDVVELASSTGDLTGSLINSDHPVQVISGHYCAYVPNNVTACDHLEESMFPVDTLGTHYIVSAPAVTTIPNGKAEVIRIIATAPNTTLTFDPPQAGAGTTIANAGGFVEISSNNQNFQITSDQKVLVAQYMEGEEAGGGTGDPAMTLAVPVEQFRASYLFHAPTSYESNYVDVTAPMGATVTLDGGMPLTFTAIGTSGYGIARVQALGAGPANDGNHNIQGDQGFGITVYGYGQYTSYWYPGGLNLESILE